MKILNSKKSILTIICLLAIFAGIGAVYSVAKEEKGITKFLNGPTPSITNAFIDKEKYFPGDTMAITAETKNASEVKAFVENESGYNEATLVVAASFEGKETWSGKWKVENALSGKKYKLKIIASNKSGTAETVLEWEDPNPGHPWSQIDAFPAACGGNDFVKGVGAALTCATPASGSPTTWTCNDVLQIAVTTPWDGTRVGMSATCVTGKAVGGRCAYSPGSPCPSPYFGTSFGGGNTYTCGCWGSDNPPMWVYVVCCQ